MRDHDDDSEPQYSDDALVCQCSSFWGDKVIAVIVDQAAGMIHFQNCFRKNWSLSLRAQCWCSCPLTDLRYSRHFCNKGNCSLTITTETGTATISAKASNYDALRSTLESIIPPVRGLIRDFGDVLGLTGFGAIGGFLVGIALAGMLLPRNTTGALFGAVIVMSAIVGMALAACFGNWLLKRKYRR